MAELIEKLTEKIYKEGVVKARREADEIISNAKQQKSSIIDEARSQAKAILEKTKKESDELKSMVEADLQMAAQKSMAVVRQKISGLISSSIAEESSMAVTSDKDFLADVLMKIVDKWSSSDHTTDSLLLKLSKADKESLGRYFAGKMKDKLKNKIIIEADSKIRAGFVITPADSSFRIGFTDQDFIEFFKFFIQIRIKEILFKK